jgi:hypothetical protein
MPAMSETSRQTSVTFTRSFWLEGVEGTYPPGTYAIEESREEVSGLSFVGYRRTKTTIELPGLNAALVSRRLVEVEPADLEAALARELEAANGEL